MMLLYRLVLYMFCAFLHYIIDTDFRPRDGLDSLPDRLVTRRRRRRRRG